MLNIITGLTEGKATLEDINELEKLANMSGMAVYAALAKLLQILFSQV